MIDISTYIRGLLHAREIMVKSGNTKGIEELDNVINKYKSML